jgi:hypothetical protein
MSTTLVPSYDTIVTIQINSALFFEGTRSLLCIEISFFIQLKGAGTNLVGYSN